MNGRREEGPTSRKRRGRERSNGDELSYIKEARGRRGVEQRGGGKKAEVGGWKFRRKSSSHYYWAVRRIRLSQQSLAAVRGVGTTHPLCTRTNIHRFSIVSPSLEFHGSRLCKKLSRFKEGCLAHRRAFSCSLTEPRIDAHTHPRCSQPTGRKGPYLRVYQLRAVHFM